MGHQFEGVRRTPKRQQKAYHLYTEVLVNNKPRAPHQIQGHEANWCRRRTVDALQVGSTPIVFANYTTVVQLEERRATNADVCRFESCQSCQIRRVQLDRQSSPAEAQVGGSIPSLSNLISCDGMVNVSVCKTDLSEFDSQQEIHGRVCCRVVAAVLKTDGTQRWVWESHPTLPPILDNYLVRWPAGPAKSLVLERACGSRPQLSAKICMDGRAAIASDCRSDPNGTVVRIHLHAPIRVRRQKEWHPSSKRTDAGSSPAGRTIYDMLIKDTIRSQTDSLPLRASPMW